MPHLGDIPEEVEAREFGVDNAVDDATCCVPGRGATGSAAMTVLPDFAGIYHFAGNQNPDANKF